MKKHEKNGRLVIIGGHEDKDGDREILTDLSRQAGGKLVVITAATQSPEDVGAEYTRIFTELGVKEVEVINFETRHDAYDPDLVQKIAGAQVIFFTGGDQLKITGKLGATPALACMRERHELYGVTIAGTSAGAAAMPEVMLISGPSHKSNEVWSVGMAPGLGLIKGVVIDSHFAERGRIGRLLGAVAQHPGMLGVGIDEDTALIEESDGTFRVAGSGAVYFVDGEGVSYSSLSEDSAEGILDLHDIRLHVLGNNSRFDIINRRPIVGSNAAVSAG